jgi:hypothetical protein
MEFSEIDKMNQEELKSYLEFLLWHYRVVDGFWFLFVSEDFHQKAAEKINERVWAKAADLAAKSLLKRFNIEDKGLKGFVKAQKLFPWHIIIGYEFEEREDEVILTVPSCASQVARLRNGLPENACKAMHQGEFENFARAVDDRIQVECIFAPPDPHPENIFCKWKFTLKKDDC